MNKVKILSFISIGLLIANLALIGFLISNKSRHPKRERPFKIISEKLKFDELQVGKYEDLIKTHQASMKVTEEQLLSLKNELYTSLADTSKKKMTDSLFAEIGKQQASIEKIHYNHFLDLKNLCRPEQMSAFEALSSNIAKLFAPPQAPNPPRDKR